MIRNTIITKVKVIENIELKKNIDPRLLRHYKFVDYPVSKEGLFLELPPIRTENVDEYVYLCIVYNPPENSPYVNLSCFEELEVTLLNIGANSIILTGDFNARTGEMKDFINPCLFTDEMHGNTTTADLFDIYKIQKARCAMDKHTNNFGHKLIDFCISQQILLLNGRKDADAGTGQVTSKDVSTVDYVIASPHLFTSLTNFSVGEFCKCLSDVHSPIYFDIMYRKEDETSPKLAGNEKSNDNARGSVSIPRWKTDAGERFLREINNETIEITKQALYDLHSNIERISQEEIDEVTESVSDIMSQAAKSLGMVKPLAKPGKPKNNPHIALGKKVWFSKECSQTRATYRLWKGRFKQNKGCTDTKTKRNDAHKLYKRSLTKNYKAYVKNFQKKIRAMKSADPSSYWRLINGDSKQKQNISNSISHDIFAKHFEKLSNAPNGSLIDANTDPDNSLNNAQLNMDITEEEVMFCVKRLKNNKACGFDGILNEFLKHSAVKMVAVITSLFNLIFKSGKMPKVWAFGQISPIYKGKGNTSDPNNYRGITVISCFAKLFTSIINKRVCAFLEENSLLGNEQAGFRKGHSTLDHLFALHCLIDIYLQKKKKLYCAFVDFRKAFDSVQHGLLWHKLLQMNVDGKVLDILRDLYDKTKLCVKHNMTRSHLFTSNIGLLQGENLSPILFSMFLNDFKSFLGAYDVSLSTPIHTAQNFGMEDIQMYMYLFLLLYADDMVLLAETPADLQRALNGLSEYCKKWGLTVNVDKTKVLIFSKGKTRNIPAFSLDEQDVEVVWDYAYLGVLFNYNNKFQKAQRKQCTAGNRAMFSLLRKCRELNLPIDIQIELFEKCVIPVCLYGCEVWGHESLELVKKNQLRFLKIVLGVGKSTPTCMILGDTGCYPIQLNVNSRLLTFWYKLMQDMSNNSHKLSCLMLKLQLKLYEDGNYKLPWLSHVHSTLNNLGLSYLWQNQALSVNNFKKMINQRMKDQYIQSWENEVSNNSICYNYRMFKTIFCYEQYLSTLERPLRDYLIRIRLSNHRLPIHSKRFVDIPRNERLCELCNLGEIGDEYHYIFVCKDERIVRERNVNIKQYYRNRPNAMKYQRVMNTKQVGSLRRLARLSGHIMKLF